MGDTARLEAELELAKLGDALEQARDAMHEDGSEANVAAYKEASNALAAARTSYREQHRDVVGGDGLVAVETVEGTTGVKE